ncbi:acyl carrier protein [Pseudonocardia spinosispora]|uniref:acyl carrier protein n=1 Tax=Pseudonocardia spinosispora TaxID=103441 RepID=UPI000491FF71|nr:acyl carrier protein [Pseudonocardia spinosispora]
MTVLENRLSLILSDNFGISADDIAGNRTFFELDVDSLILIEFALLIKKEFGVVLVEGELRPEFTVEDAAALLVSKGLEV